MPGGGEKTLVAYGTQNIIVSGQPQFTNFYSVFRRYTHFSQESISIPMDGVNELSLDYPVRLRAKIPRHADAMTDLQFVFRLPDIYSKIWQDTTDPSGMRVPAFRWIHMIGPLLIDNAAIYVGGSKIQEFPGEWLVARATADYPADKYLKWRSMVGDVPELHSPEWGIYGKSANYPYQKGEYPHAIPDPFGRDMAPSIPHRVIRVPLPFWFTEGWGRCLPLLCLQLHDVEVQLTLRSLREVYRIMDQETQVEPVQCGRRFAVNPLRPLYKDPTMIGAAPDNVTLQDDYESYTEPYILPRYFYTDAPVTETARIPSSDGFVLNAHLEANYVYMTERERATFTEREIQTLVHQVQTFRYASIVTRTKLDLDVHGLASRILFYGRRTDAIDGRNDYINCSNWKNLAQAPYWPLAVGGTVPNSGLFVPYTQRDILQTARLLLDGTEAFEEKPASWFELERPFFNTEGQGTTGLHPGAIKPDDVMGPIYQIPFALNGSDHLQPSGTLNTSRTHQIQLEVNPWELSTTSNYAYDFTVFVETLNQIKYMNGMAGLAFAI